jgi:hypothetical protein
MPNFRAGALNVFERLGEKILVAGVKRDITAATLCERLNSPEPVPSFRLAGVMATQKKKALNGIFHAHGSVL